MDPAADVVIVGGGIIGLTTAYFLAREGCKVHVLERGDLGQEASWAGAGILPPSDGAFAQSPFDKLRALSLSLIPGLSAELKKRTGIDNGFLVSGGIELVNDSGAVAAEEWRGEGVRIEPLDEHALHGIEPSLANGLGPALLLPDMAQLRNPRHVRALVEACASAGVRLSTNAPVRGFASKGSRIEAVQTDSADFHADRFLIAAGSWTGPVMAALGINVPVRPIRGQIALLRTSVALSHILVCGARYIVPRGDGLVLIGSTEEDVGFDKRTTEVAIADLVPFAIGLVPAFAGAVVEKSWAGLRPASRDGMPYLGAVPGWENIYISAGHFRAGIQTSTGSAQLLKQLILDQPLSLSLSPFRVERIGDRVSSRGWED